MTIEDRNYTVQLTMFTKYSNIVWQLKTEIILIQLTMFTEYSNIVWQLKTEIILIQLSMFTNTPMLYDNWRQKLYSCTNDNVYWILQYCMTIEDRNYTHAQLTMFTKYSNIVWQLKTEIILMHNWQCLLNTPILYDNWRQKLYSLNTPILWQCLLNTPILYDNWRQKLYSCTIDNVY